MNINLVFFLVWLTTSFLLTSYLKKRVVLFKKIGTSRNFFGIFIIFLVLHKIISDLLNIREITFLFLSILSFGIFLSLIILNKKKCTRKKRTEHEVINVQKISAQSQLKNYKKKSS